MVSDQHRQTFCTCIVFVNEQYKLAKVYNSELCPSLPVIFF